MSSTGRQTVNVQDLVDEAKKRIVLLVICVVGLSYLMSLTSTSVLVNLPAALFLILLLRYMSLDFDIRRKASTYKGKQRSEYFSSERGTFEGLRALERSDWRLKVYSPVVEDAIEQFARHIVSEWVTNLWYSRVTPDKQGPEELVLIMNGALGEICRRMRNINLIDLLTRDIISILCSRLELFRASKKKIEKNRTEHLTVEEQDMKLKSILAAENKLHPILFSAEAEYKVLQHVMDALILLTFQSKDLQCSLFRYITRELLSCVVMRPVLNLANPRFVNERIELAVISARKTGKGNSKANTLSPPWVNESPSILSNQNSQFPDPSIKGFELVQLKKGQDNRTAKNLMLDDMSGTLLSKDPLLSMDTRTTRSWSSFPDDHSGVVKGVQQQGAGGEWGDVLDEFSRRKTEALAPEHFDNMWAKGRNYKRKEDTNQNPMSRDSLVGVSKSVDKPKFHSQLKKEQLNTSSSMDKDVSLTRPTPEKEEDSDALHGNFLSDTFKSNSIFKEEDFKSGSSAETESWSSSYTEDDETSAVMHLDSHGVNVWDSKNKRNFSRIHDPLETFERADTKISSIQKYCTEESLRKKDRGLVVAMVMPGKRLKGQVFCWEMDGMH